MGQEALCSYQALWTQLSRKQFCHGSYTSCKQLSFTHLEGNKGSIISGPSWRPEGGHICKYPKSYYLSASHPQSPSIFSPSQRLISHPRPSSIPPLWYCSCWEKKTGITISTPPSEHHNQPQSQRREKGEERKEKNLVRSLLCVF